jgi:CHAT domain-containing protein
VLVTSAPTGSDDDAAAMRATKWFGDAHALAQLPSLQTLQFLRAMPRSHSSLSDGFEGFGDPKLRGIATARGGAAVLTGAVASVDQLASLPGTADELRRIASALNAPASAVHLGDGDTKSAVGSLDLSHAKVLAFATHGLLPGELQGVDEPGLVFTPPATPNPDDDGFLSTSDITRLKLDADLVVLSACNSGSGGGENAPPLSGLARAFFYAGARALLVSHWPVYDDVAPRITVELVAARHADPNLSLAEALQTATRKVREDKDDPSLAFPSAWAPFVVVGDWRR